LILLCLLASSLAWANPGEEEAAPASASLWSATLAGPLSQAKQTVGDKSSELLGRAMGLLGIPYKYGGSSEKTGFDCSGFVRHLYEKSFGKLLPRRADDQARVTETIDASELQPGDLVFFNTMRRTFSHVGLYVGDGKFIHSPQTGKSVQIDDMRAAYWQKRFSGARRVQTPPQSEPSPSESKR
jgi:cell wall-associated NlpC family hydrolase